MALDEQYYAEFKTHIEANTAPVVVAALASGANNVIASWYNVTASPDYYAWRSSMTVDEVRKLVDWDEVVSSNTNTLLSFQILIGSETIDPSNASVRGAFTSIFSGPSGVNSRTALADASKELVSEAEALFSDETGAGSIGDPDTYGFEGTITHQDVTAALNS